MDQPPPFDHVDLVVQPLPLFPPPPMLYIQPMPIQPMPIQSIQPQINVPTAPNQTVQPAPQAPQPIPAPQKPQPQTPLVPDVKDQKQMSVNRFHQLAKQKELNSTVARQLEEILPNCDIVLLCDDSDSMQQAIAEEGTDPFAVKRSTRWMELKKLAAVIIDFATALNPAGLDVYFLVQNRAKAVGVTSVQGLSAIFNQLPTGGTPLCGTIRQILAEKTPSGWNRSMLLVVITDGEPTDGSRDDLKNVLLSKSRNVHVSFAECTDNAEDMEYLDAWDGQIPNFDNTDDYREELQRVKQVQGPQFKFDYTDYVVKILLATFVRWYFNLDQTKVSTLSSGSFVPPPSSSAQPVYTSMGSATPWSPPPTQQSQVTLVTPFQSQPSFYAQPPPPSSCCTLL